MNRYCSTIESSSTIVFFRKHGGYSVYSNLKPIRKRFTPEFNTKWRFPKIGVPRNHPFLDGSFPYKPSIWWYLHLWIPPNPFNGSPCPSDTSLRRTVRSAESVAPTPGLCLPGPPTVLGSKLGEQFQLDG